MSVEMTSLVEDVEAIQREEIETPDGLICLPAYVPTIEETIKASGAHRQSAMPA